METQETPKMLLTAAEMIRALGGPTRMARLLFKDRSKRAMIGMWLSRDVIPPMWRILVAEKLKAKGFAVHPSFLDPRAAPVPVFTAPPLSLTEADAAFAPDLKP